MPHPTVPVRPVMLADARGVLFDARHCVRLDPSRGILLPTGGESARRRWGAARRHLVHAVEAALDPRFAAGVVVGIALLAAVLQVR